MRLWGGRANGVVLFSLTLIGGLSLVVSGVYGGLTFGALSAVLIGVGLFLLGGDYSVFSCSLGVLMFCMMVYLCWVIGEAMEYVLVLLLGGGVLGVLVSNTWFEFFVFYEGVVMPLFYVVVVWGGYYERVSSVYYLFLYTLILATPIVLFILYCVVAGCELGFIGGDLGGVFLLMCWGVGLAMLVKVPVWGVHGWLPKVHVEASTLGSILLAGIVIKLGVYGVWALNISGLCWGPAFVVWACLGGLCSIVVCFYIGDMKSLIAYSSIVHMSLGVAVLLYGVSGGSVGALLIVIVHGLVASGLFYIGGYWAGFGGSRSVVVVKGGVSLVSGMGVLVFLLWCLNMGFPVSGGFVGEIDCLGVLWVGGWEWGLYVMAYMLGCCLFSFYVVMLLGGGWEWGGVAGWENSQSVVLLVLVFVWVVLYLLAVNVYV